ncbi:hypothetical protein [Pseudogracilibacillus sp. SO30301A]|uniref:hypothetical protein n=1 Tax=Pseudogracilibacillus sp. SO30301A TaxID=3098291 RepID=UPI00300E43EC
MEKIKVIYKFKDGEIDNLKETVVYRIDDNNILSEEVGDLVIEKITYETEEGLIIDYDDKEYIPAISISLQNVDINITDQAVRSFAKYLIKMRDKQ